MPKGQITCLLSGTFNNYYDIDRTREILEVLREKINIRIIWARAGESPLEKLGVGEDVIISASHSEMPKIVRESHFGIAICKHDGLDSLSAAVPTKIGEYGPAEDLHMVVCGLVGSYFREKFLND